MKDFSVEIQMQDRVMNVKWELYWVYYFLKSCHMIKYNYEMNMYVHPCAKTMIQPIFKTEGLSKQAKEASFVTWRRWESVCTDLFRMVIS